MSAPPNPDSTPPAKDAPVPIPRATPPGSSTASHPRPDPAPTATTTSEPSPNPTLTATTALKTSPHSTSLTTMGSHPTLSSIPPTTTTLHPNLNSLPPVPMAPPPNLNLTPPANTATQSSPNSTAPATTASDLLITTHVLDTTTSRPAVNLKCILKAMGGPSWEASTDDNGHITDWIPASGGTLKNFVDDWKANGAADSIAAFQLQFLTADYFGRDNTLYLGVQITIMAKKEEGHYHLPLLLGPNSYRTYRGA